MSREEKKKQRELDEARKAGTAPAAVDEDGKAINPHIPSYIVQAPWYLDQSGKTSLKHQRNAKGGKGEFININEWYDRGAKAVSLFHC